MNHVNIWGNSPVLLSAWRGHNNILQFLLRHGADLNVTDHAQETALHKAAGVGSIQVVRTILDYYSQPQKSLLRSCTSPQGTNQTPGIDSRNKCKRTALHVACKGVHPDVERACHFKSAHPEVVKLLIAAGADIHALDAQGKSPVHWACVGPSAQALSSLQVASFLIRKGANVNLTDVDGASPLHLACSNGQLDLMSFLIKSGAFLSLERLCDRSLILEMLNKDPPVNKIMLYNILQENALLPHPQPGCNFRVYRCNDIFETNILDVIDPDRLRMLYTLGYHIPGIYGQALDAHQRKPVKDDKWTSILEHITATDNTIQRLSEICRFSIRSHLGIGIRHKIDGLLLPNPENYIRFIRMDEFTYFPLPNKLKDFLMFSELDEDNFQDYSSDYPLR